MRKKIAIITSGYLPVPATRGGGVEVLDEYLINENEKSKLVDFIVFSSYEKMASIKAQDYSNCKIEFIKTPSYIERMDKIIYFLAKYLFKVKKNSSYRYIFQRLYFINRVSKILSIEMFDKIG